MLFDTENLGDEINIHELDVLKKLGLYKDYKNDKVIYLYQKFKDYLNLKKQQMNSIQYPNPLDEFPDLRQFN